jgi:hypothetical protein
LKTEVEIRQEANRVIEQLEKVRDKNLLAQKKLGDRLVALLWVLEHPQAPESLTFTDKQLEVLSALW